MVAGAPERRSGRLAGAAGIALLLAGLTLLLEPPSWRAPAAAFLAVGLAVGAVAALRRPASGRLRSPMERLNDAAFVVVVAAVTLIAVRLARPVTAALPGLVGGFLIGFALRPRPTPERERPRPTPERERPQPTSGREPEPGQAETPPADPGAPEPGG
jgi:uncharacterized membrane protein